MERISKSVCPVPKGILLIIGGHENKEGIAEGAMEEANNDPLEILDTFISLTGERKPVLEIVTTAGEDGAAAFNDYKKIFAKMGHKNLGHIHHNTRKEILNEDLEARVAKADGIFFTGGDQLKLTSIYGGTTFLTQLKLHYIRRKLVLAGTSAGAMAFSTPMIFSGTAEKQQIVGEIRVATGLEFLKDVCIDTHFVDRSRSIRMSQVIATNPTCIGIGIEEDTALVLRKGCEITVIGSGTVTVIEGFGIEDSNILEYGEDKCIAVTGLTENLIGKGGCYLVKKINPPHL